MFMSLFVSISFITTIVGCNNKNPNEEKHEFYYYPGKNIYYDVANGTFIYSLDGAKTWTAMNGDLNDSISLGRKEIIHTTTDSIWKDNEDHRKSFGGSLYNLSAAVDSINNESVVTERKTVKKGIKKRTGKPVKVEKEKKQPIRNFFKKIFGKKKDNREK
jgi:hypothetical protein